MKPIAPSDAVTANAADAQQSTGEPLTRGPFLKSTWYAAGWSSEFESSPAARTIINEPVVCYRKQDGTLVALEDRCAHRWAPLSLGRVEGDELRCMYHGIKFRPDGLCSEVPGQDRIAKSLCVRAYPVVERHRLVWIWMGDPTQADPRLIPDLSLGDRPAMHSYQGSLDYQAHYSLICDNLLDLSHLAYLHERTLGRPVAPISQRRTKPRIPDGSGATRIDGGVRVEGWLFGRSAFLPKKVPDGDLWSRVDFLVPGIYVSHARMYPEGTAEKCGGRPPEEDLAPLSDSISIQAVTPITARETRYFYSIGHRMSDMDAAEADEIWKIVLEAFAEDLRMIEAQQRIIDTHPGRPMGGIAADRGLTLFRTLMKKRITAEAAAAAGADRRLHARSEAPSGSS